MPNEKEIRALRFYQGDIDKKDMNDPFRGDAKAYVTLNSLLFPAGAGLAAEMARAAEGRRLNPVFIEESGRTIELLRTLRGLMKPECGNGPDAWEECGITETFRVERLAEYRCIKDSGMLPSFISTSLEGFLPAYRDKKDLVLMNFHIRPGVPRADLGKLLAGNYAKKEEAEVLLAPYLPVRLRERSLIPAETTVCDCLGRPPVIACDIWPGNAVLRDAGISRMPRQKADDILGNAAYPAAGIRVYEALNSGSMPEAGDKEKYLEFKSALQCRVISG